MKKFITEARKDVRALTAAELVASGAGLLTGSVAIWVAGSLAAAAAGLAAYERGA